MPEILSSWKEIATYLGKGVRTVQRWERELGLPVHRPDARRQRIVMAFEKELAEWVQRQHGRNGNGQYLPTHPPRALQNTAVLVERMKRLTRVAAELHQKVIASLAQMEDIRTRSTKSGMAARGPITVAAGETRMERLPKKTA